MGKIELKLHYLEKNAKEMNTSNTLKISEDFTNSGFMRSDIVLPVFKVNGGLIVKMKNRALESSNRAIDKITLLNRLIHVLAKNISFIYSSFPLYNFFFRAVSCRLFIESNGYLKDMPNLTPFSNHNQLTLILRENLEFLRKEIKINRKIYTALQNAREKVMIQCKITKEDLNSMMTNG